MDNVKKIIQDLWKAGHKREASTLLKLARSLSQEERNLQYKIFNSILSGMGVEDARLEIDAKKGIASFNVSGISIVEFPRFIEKVMRQLYENGTKKYKLEKIDRESDPMKVFIRI